MIKVLSGVRETMTSMQEPTMLMAVKNKDDWDNPSAVWELGSSDCFLLPWVEVW